MAQNSPRELANEAGPARAATIVSLRCFAQLLLHAPRAPRAIDLSKN